MERDAVVSTSRPKWQTLIRQNSEKIGNFAEVAVLPKSQRSIKRENELEGTVKDVESQSTTTIPTSTVKHTQERQKKYFPFFMIGISLIEVLLMYTIDDQILMMIFGYDPHRRHELWRYITIMLAHTGLTHLWTNVIFQMILGVLLEIVHGWKRIAIIYLSSVFGGSLFTTLLSPGSYGVGASAGVYGLLFSHLATIIINWNEMDRKCCRVFWLVFYVIFDIGTTVLSELAAKSTSNTSHVGHLGGAITGFLVSIFVLKNFEKHPWEKRMQKVCIGIIVALCCIIFLVNVTAWSYYPATEWNFDYGNTYTKDILNSIVQSPEDSSIRELCDKDSDCKKLLEQYKFNGTVNSSLI